MHAIPHQSLMQSQSQRQPPDQRFDALHRSRHHWRGNSPRASERYARSPWCSRGSSHKSWRQCSPAGSNHRRWCSGWRAQPLQCPCCRSPCPGSHGPQQERGAYQIKHPRLGCLDGRFKPRSALRRAHHGTTQALAPRWIVA